MGQNNFEDWELPKWHADFGNPLSEFENLKSFCKVLLNKKPQYLIELDCYEEGYMNVNLYLENQVKIAELHVVNSDIYTYGLFLEHDEDDKYFSTIEEGISFL